MQISKTLLISLVAGVAVAAPSQEVSVLSKRTCWELTGSALQICQSACAVACEAASFGLFGTACASACAAGNLKRDNQIAARADTDVVTIAASTNATTPLIHVVQVTDIDAVTFPLADKSASRTACVVACEITCNSTVLALIQTKCLEKCKALCPSS